MHTTWYAMCIYKRVTIHRFFFFFLNNHVINVIACIWCESVVQCETIRIFHKCIFLFHCYAAYKWMMRKWMENVVSCNDIYLICSRKFISKSSSLSRRKRKIRFNELNFVKFVLFHFSTKKLQVGYFNFPPSCNW